jgi:beta-lactam-binding protein with PASTA domain
MPRTQITSLTGVSQVSMGDGTAFAVAESGTTPVPDVGGLPTAQATNLLQAAGLVRGSVRNIADCEDVGLVVAQDPVAGTMVQPGTAVSLTVGTQDRNCR